MQPEQIHGIAQFLLDGIERETQTTRKVIAVIPDGNSDYRPDPKARSARELAWHIVFSDVWFLDSIAKSSFPMEQETIPEGVRTIADMNAWYEKNMAAGIESARGLSAGHLAKPVEFFGMFNMPVGLYLDFLNNHMIHHRGQLSTYLRPMGSKVPSIYGGSADEPMNM